MKSHYESVSSASFYLPPPRLSSSRPAPLLPSHVMVEICAAFYGRSVDQVLFPTCWHDSSRLVKAKVITFLCLLKDTVNCLSFFYLDYLKQSWKTCFSAFAHCDLPLKCFCETLGGRVCVCVCVCDLYILYPYLNWWREKPRTKWINSLNSLKFFFKYRNRVGVNKYLKYLQNTLVRRCWLIKMKFCENLI